MTQLPGTSPSNADRLAGTWPRPQVACPVETQSIAGGDMPVSETAASGKEGPIHTPPFPGEHPKSKEFQYSQQGWREGRRDHAEGGRGSRPLRPK